MVKHVYLIAGEASGDFLGAQLMQALKKREPEVVFSGIGGPLMEAQGLKSFFSITELSLMGIWEIAPKIFSVLRRINQTVSHIRKIKPDVVVTIDAPDFSFRVQKKVYQIMAERPKQVHYVAPTVWAWRPKRAQKISQFLDAVICLFDFEPDYFEKEGLKAVAVGHPMMESGITQALPAKIGDSRKQKLGVFFGSRQGEFKRLAPEFLRTINLITQEKPDIELVVPTLPHLEGQVGRLLSQVEVPVHIITDQEQKWSVFKACDVALAVSGTVGLELAAADVPHVIGYKMNVLTWQIVKRVIQTPFAHLANIIAGKEVVPEFIQGDCIAEDVSAELLALLEDEELQQKQRKEFSIVRKAIGEDKKPSENAASFLLSVISNACEKSQKVEGDSSIALQCSE